MHMMIATHMDVLSFDNIHRNQRTGQCGSRGEGFVQLERPGDGHAEDEAVLRAACAIDSDSDEITK